MSMLFVTEFSFDIGTKEKHKISFRYSKWMGRITLKSDGIDIARTTVLILGQNHF